MPGKDRRSGTSRGGALSEEDRALWELVTREAKPLKKKAPSAPPAPARPETAPDAPAAVAAKRVAKRALPARPPIPPMPPAKPAPPIRHGDIAGVDKRTAERMRRGRMAVDATLDLHGRTQRQAHREVSEFLAGAQAAGKRCVLIVTGKGVGTEGGGVLRAQVPRWLNEPDNRRRVLAFDYAQPQHGGMGALYVLLRKTRP